MKNRKKLLVLLMCTCMLLGTTACGNRRDTQNDTTMNDATDKTKDNNDKTDRNENRTDAADGMTKDHNAQNRENNK